MVTETGRKPPRFLNENGYRGIRLVQRARSNANGKGKDAGRGTVRPARPGTCPGQGAGQGPLPGPECDPRSRPGGTPVPFEAAFRPGRRFRLDATPLLLRLWLEHPAGRAGLL